MIYSVSEVSEVDVLLWLFGRSSRAGRCCNVLVTCRPGIPACLLALCNICIISVCARLLWSWSSSRNLSTRLRANNTSWSWSIFCWVCITSSMALFISSWKHHQAFMSRLYCENFLSCYWSQQILSSLGSCNGCRNMLISNYQQHLLFKHLKLGLLSCSGWTIFCLILLGSIAWQSPGLSVKTTEGEGK